MDGQCTKGHVMGADGAAGNMRSVLSLASVVDVQQPKFTGHDVKCPLRPEFK